MCLLFDVVNLCTVQHSRVPDPVTDLDLLHPVRVEHTALLHSSAAQLACLLYLLLQPTHYTPVCQLLTHRCLLQPVHACRRLLQNPSYYDLESTDAEAVSAYLSSMVQASVLSGCHRAHLALYMQPALRLVPTLARH